MPSRRVIAVGAVVVVAIAAWMYRGHRATSRNAREGSAAIASRDGVRSGSAKGQHVSGRRIAGIVYLDGAPAPNATVRLTSRLTPAGPHVVADANGAFDLGVQPTASYVVVAELPRTTAAVAAIDLDDAAPVDALRLDLHACDASIHGTIYDAAGGTIAKARVSRLEDDGTPTAGVDADAHGKYELCVPVGSETVGVDADGYARTRDEISAYGHMRRDFSLVPEAIVTGRVVRAGDHAPVAGAQIVLRPIAALSGDSAPVLYATSDPEGRFRIDGATPGRHSIDATADHLAMERSMEVVAETGATTDEVTCTLVGTFAISGTVIEQGTNAPIAGEVVRASGNEHMFEATTQADGSFTIEQATAGTYYLDVVAYSLPKRTTITVAKAEVHDVRVEVESPGSISGRVLHDGKPVDGVDVNAAYARAVTDHDGRFTLRGLRAGNYTINAESQRLGAFTNTKSITLAKGEHKTDVDVTLDLEGSIAGIVVDQNDAPVAGVSVTFSLLQGHDFGVATTADDGTFVARAMAGGGDYVFEVRQQETRMAYASADGKRFAPITVQDGQTHITGKRIKIRVDRLTIAGHVLDASGKPAADVAIRGTPANHASYQTITAVTDSLGAFTLRDLRAGTYGVTASAVHGAYQEQEHVAAGTSNLVLRLEAPGEIEGTLEGFTDVPNIHVGGTDGAHTPIVSGNTFVVHNLRPGDYWLVAQSQNGRDTEHAYVTSGVSVKVTLHRRHYGVVIASVVDEAHAPVSGLWCGLLNSGRPATDDHGKYRIEQCLEGDNKVDCRNETMMASAKVHVVADQTVEVELVASARKPIEHGSIGMAMEQQLDEVRVTSVVPGGPADRAGVAIGDVVIRIDDQPPTRLLMGMRDWSWPVGATVKLTIEHDDTQRTVQLTAIAQPASQPK